MHIEKELLAPKIDVVFHALFRRANNTLLEAMLTAILETKVKIISNLDRHMNISQVDEKFGIMDLRVEFEDKTNCNVEIQLREHEYEKERFLYYLADNYSRQLRKGSEYDEISKTISIVIVDHEIDKLKGLESLNVRWQMRDDKTGKRILTDKFELVIIELPKAKRIYSIKNQDKISQWMMFLDNPNSEEVAEIMDKNKDIKKATEELKHVCGDYELRRMAEWREKGRRDENAALSFAIKKGLKQGFEQGLEKGLEQGKQKGIEQGIIKTAKNMLKMNMDVKIIKEATGLSEDEIEKIK